MAKPMRTPKQNRNKSTDAQGLGYFIPDSMPNAEWQKIKQKWDQQLLQSGFDDIEMYSHALDGHFFPTFSQNSIDKNIKTQAGPIGAGIAGYYDYCSSFYECADFKLIFNTKRYKRKWALQRELFRLHKDGVSYGDVRLALQGKRSTYMKRFNVAPSHRKFRQRRSKYWIFFQTRLILSEMWYWQATAGTLTPYDLEHMQCTGISQEVILRAKAFVSCNIHTSTIVAGGKAD